MQHLFFAVCLLRQKYAHSKVVPYSRVASEHSVSTLIRSQYKYKMERRKSGKHVGRWRPNDGICGFILAPPPPLLLAEFPLPQLIFGVKWGQESTNGIKIGSFVVASRCLASWPRNWISRQVLLAGRDR